VPRNDLFKQKFLCKTRRRVPRREWRGTRETMGLTISKVGAAMTAPWQSRACAVRLRSWVPCSAGVHVVEGDSHRRPATWRTAACVRACTRAPPQARPVVLQLYHEAAHTLGARLRAPRCLCVHMHKQTCAARITARVEPSPSHRMRACARRCLGGFSPRRRCAF
jgi:hypothetical protein